MPLYEYACEKCGELTEVMQKVSDPAPAKCPHCGSKKLSKVMSRTSFQLKGGGWYAEGYSSGSANAKKATGSESSSSAEKSSSKPEKKTSSSSSTTKKD
jgi:putative FmdB family regulatory protein